MQDRRYASDRLFAIALGLIVPVNDPLPCVRDLFLHEMIMKCGEDGYSVPEMNEFDSAFQYAVANQVARYWVSELVDIDREAARCEELDQQICRGCGYPNLICECGAFPYEGAANVIETDDTLTHLARYNRTLHRDYGQVIDVLDVRCLVCGAPRGKDCEITNQDLDRRLFRPQTAGEHFAQQAAEEAGEAAYEAYIQSQYQQ